MAGTVKLPVVGTTSKRTLYLGGGAAVLVMGVLWWRKRNAAPPAAPAATGATDTSGLDTTGLDFGGSGMAGGGGSLVSTPPAATTPTDNAQWTALVVQQLSFVADPQALSAALGKYLTGSAVTPDQESLIDQAIAAAGYPPVAGPNGYPPAIRTQPSTGQGGGDTNTYMFHLINDVNPAAIYVGIPGRGWYWAPNVAALSQYIQAKHPADLGTITVTDAQTKFGTQSPWSLLPLG